MRLYAISSLLHSELSGSACEDPFIKDIEAALGTRFTFRGDDFSSYGTDGDSDIIYVRTGGTEGLFRSAFEKNGELVIPGGKAVRLLTSGQSNSLAASMEILTYLNQRGFRGEILHGSTEEIASMLRFAGMVTECDVIHEIRQKDRSAQGTARCRESESEQETETRCESKFVKRGMSCQEPKSTARSGESGAVLSGIRLGVVGKPSDWLISSDVDYARAKSVLGAELVDVEMDELCEEIGKGGYSLAEGITLRALNSPLYGKAFRKEDFAGALDIYGALGRLAAKYRLNGLTIRCFDLLTRVRKTGCLALAILNAEGKTAACEGDVPAMLTMAVTRRLFGTSGFQVNLSRIEGDLCLFAHCTVPLNMVALYCYDRHFESGIGVAIHGEFTPGPFTIFKISSDLRHFIAEDVELVENRYSDCLCRTQVVVKAPGLSGYLLRSPLGNHHVLVPGHHSAELREALR